MKPPFHLEYLPVMSAWHSHSQFRLVDFEGEEVCMFKQYVEHPGLIDEKAEAIAVGIAEALNHWVADPNRVCPSCHSKGFPVSEMGPGRCTFCDGSEGGS